ncbi:dentin sialophosphoprotein-like isoform X2 [Portunus trituberculatus]|uniref:dentin sialophosphoprotein-like isoform X2 n=1 Tax=Portunus trituberculatus TaxID=210409 RepID=UPI001E1D18A1|nr:dentin sialophosphoprotein-like isoform X2 [Portunus trituberculatus]
MARAAPWIVICLVTWAASARLPGDEGDPEQRPLIISSVSLPGDQRNDPISSFGSETKGEPAMNLAEGTDRTDGHAGKTTGSISFISTRDDQGVVRSHSSDSTSDVGHENKHDSRTGYKSDGHYKEYSYYDQAGYGDNGFDHGRDDLIDFIHLDNGGEESAKELTDWDSYYVLKSQGQNCSDGGGGVHSCLQDSEDEDTDDSDECAHDDEDCDGSRARLRAYLGRDEDEEEEGSEVEVEDEDDEYLLKPKFLDDDSDDEDDGNDDVNDEDNDDDDDDKDVYLYVDDNDTNLLSFLASPIEPESDGAFRETENVRNEEPVKSEAEELKRYVHTNKADQSPRADKSENVPEEIVPRSSGTADEGEVAKRDASYASWMKSSPVIGSNIQQDPSFAHDTPTSRREREIHAEYIGKKKLHDVLRKSEGPIPKEDEQGQTAMHAEKLTRGWFENIAPGVSVTETVNTNLNASPKANTQYDQNLTFMISRHDTVPYEEIYDTIMHSGQISDEEKTYIASLEQTRRLVNRLGGLETLLEQPKVHHIVKRQTNGGEACVLLRRRRRRAADEAGETERTSRIRRGISNVGKNLEQGSMLQWTPL